MDNTSCCARQARCCERRARFADRHQQAVRWLHVEMHVHCSPAIYVSVQSSLGLCGCTGWAPACTIASLTLIFAQRNRKHHNSSSTKQPFRRGSRAALGFYGHQVPDALPRVHLGHILAVPLQRGLDGLVHERVQRAAILVLAVLHRQQGWAGRQADKGGRKGQAGSETTCAVYLASPYSRPSQRAEYTPLCLHSWPRQNPRACPPAQQPLPDARPPTLTLARW